MLSKKTTSGVINRPEIVVSAAITDFCRLIEPMRWRLGSGA